MMAYVGQTRSKKLIAKLESEGIGEMTVRGELPPRRRPWAYDNGAYRDWTAEKPFDALSFVADVPFLRGVDFVVVPDIVTGGTESLRYSLMWAQRLRGLPLYLAVQDGMSIEVVKPVLGGFSGLFVGGSTQWKLDTAAGWVQLARSHNLRCHVGRVGTARRVAWAKSIGADSIDSSLPLFSQGNRRRFLDGLRQQEMFTA
jgi:hypothetical protein